MVTLIGLLHDESVGSDICISVINTYKEKYVWIFMGLTVIVNYAYA